MQKFAFTWKCNYSGVPHIRCLRLPAYLGLEATCAIREGQVSEERDSEMSEDEVILNSYSFFEKVPAPRAG